MTSLFRAKKFFDASEDKAFDDKKRKRILSASEEEDSRGSLSASKHCSDLPMSKIYNSSFRNNKPAELFRKDLISAMKLPDTDQLLPDDYWVISDTWKPEWERGVQVPVNPNAMPSAVIRCSRKKEKSDFKLPKKYLKCTYDKFFSNELHVMSTAVSQAEKVCRYDLDDVDVEWLKVLNEELEYYGFSSVDETTIELLIEEFENESFNNYQKSRKKDGIEFDEDVICDVCRSPDTEEGNEMVFCDSCNICVHQACYGITSIPEGSWLCCTCALGIEPPCLLCPRRGGAMKSTRNGQKWAHVSCALWIPEVTIGCVERMEPITKISMIPISRWQLVCSLCKEKNGACIQCSVKTCKTAYHVTCAFEHGLEMKAIIAETEEDGIKLKSFCRKHSKQKDNTSESDSEPSPRKKRRVKRELDMSTGDKKKEERTRYVASEFFSGISISNVAELLKIDLQIVDFVFQYWKLKRKANFNRPLLMPKVEELNVLGRNDEDYAKMKMFVHLRQDLERVRNLCYMVGRREKLFRSWSRVKEEIFYKQVSLISESPSLTEKEMSIILHANHGDSLYDKFYTDTEDSEVVPSLATSISILEGTFIENLETRLMDKKFINERSRRLPNPYAKKYLNGVSSRIQKRKSTEVSDTNKHNFSKSRRKSGGLHSAKDEDSSVGFSDFNSYFAERSGIPHLTLTEKHSSHLEKDKSCLQKCQDDKKKSSNSSTLLTRRLRYAKGRRSSIRADNVNYISNKGIRKNAYRNKNNKTKTGANKIYGRYSRFKSLPLSKRFTRSSLRSLNKCRIKQKFQGRKLKLQKTLASKRMEPRSKLSNSPKNKPATSTDRSTPNNKIEGRNNQKERHSKDDDDENSENEENHFTRSSLNVDCSSDTIKTAKKVRCLRSSRSLEISSNNCEEARKETRSITRQQKELFKIEEMSRELESTNITVKTEVEDTIDQKVDYEVQPNIGFENKHSKLQRSDTLEENCESSFVVGDVFVNGIEEQRIFTRSCRVDKATSNFEILPRNRTRRSSTSILNEANNSTFCRKSQRISDQQVLSENNAKLIPLSMRRRRTLKLLSVPCYPDGEENAFNFISDKEKDGGDICKEENSESVHTTDTCSGTVLTAFRSSRKLRNNYISKEDTENKERNSPSSPDTSPQRIGLRCSPRSWNYTCPLSSPPPLNGDEDIQSPRLVIRLRKDPNFPDCARWQRDSEFDSKSPDDISDDTDKQICKINRTINSENKSLHPSDVMSSDIGSKENGSRYLMRCRTLIKKNGLSRIN